MEILIYKKYREEKLLNKFLDIRQELINNYRQNYNNIQHSKDVSFIKRRKLLNLRRITIETWRKMVSSYYSELSNIHTEIKTKQNPKLKSSQTSNRKLALVVGINYVNSRYELNGCINDATNIENKLLESGYNAQNITLLTDTATLKPTKTNILGNLQRMLEYAQDGDQIFFSYSGHGSYTKDLNNDEINGYDEVIVPSDLNLITDDELKHVIQTYLKKGVTLIALVDACFSGTILDLKYRYLDAMYNNQFVINEVNLETKGSVILLSSSTDEQTSIEAVVNNKPQGAMTFCFLECLKQPQIKTWRQLLNEIRSILNKNYFHQIPQINSGSFVNIDDEIYF